MKKIPSIFRKKYTSKKLQKKILKKLFIPADKTYIESLFIEVEKKGKKQIPIFAIPAESIQNFDKKEKKRLKIIAKQIKKQKGRINFVPLIVSSQFHLALFFSKINLLRLLLQKLVKIFLRHVAILRTSISNYWTRLFVFRNLKLPIKMM